MSARSSSDPSRRAPLGGARFGAVEIPVRDAERAAAFYRRAFGWQARAVPWSGPRYLALSPGGGAGSDGATAGDAPLRAGLLAAGDDPLPHPVAVVHVEEELDAVLTRVAAGGGSVERPAHDVGGHGRFALFRDSEGNLLGLWRGAAREAGDAPQTGEAQ